MIFLPTPRPSAAAFAAALALSLGAAVSAQNAPGPVRTVLARQDTTVPGYEAVAVRVEIPVGGREGRHKHPGVAMGYVEQGTLTLEYEGRPTKDYKQGDTFVLEAGKIHEGINKGNVPIKAIATFVVTKGAALTTPAK
jgi:quercetin dioxygenase-like cupin family protein